MVIAKSIRLVNWYEFNNEPPIPLGNFTLFAGRNYSGKSTAIDAFRYAYTGDTRFNASSDAGQNKRTIFSYTRCYDNECGQFIRDAKDYPVVYSHIVLEFEDTDVEKNILLGTVIETNERNETRTYRYTIDNMKNDEIELTYEKNGYTMPYNTAELQAKYGLKMLNAEDGIVSFYQKTGLRLNKEQNRTYRRKLDMLMNYNPKVKIEEFIKKEVAEEKNIDLTDLIVRKEQITKLQHDFESIAAEIKEIDEILKIFKQYREKEGSIIVNEIKKLYAAYIECDKIIQSSKEMSEYALKQHEELSESLEHIKEKEQKATIDVSEAEHNLRELDCNKAKQQAEDALTQLEEEKNTAEKKKRALESLQQTVNELFVFMHENNMLIEDKEALSSLTLGIMKNEELEKGISNLRNSIKAKIDSLYGDIQDISREIMQNESDQSRYQNIIDDAAKKRPNYSDIANYVNLKRDINALFERKKIDSEASFACEFVIRLTDEKWRDSLECFLGPFRYIILVDPRYYDMAYKFLSDNRTKYPRTHIFNTKLLMKREVVCEDDSAVNFLEIKNPYAKKFFEYKLGRLHAVPMDEVKDYENAISKEGMVSSGMDCYPLDFSRNRAYYLGENALELNMKRAKIRIQELIEEYKQLSERKHEKERDRKYLTSIDDVYLRGKYDYNACQEYEDLTVRCRIKAHELTELEKALQKDNEFQRLNDLVESLKREKTRISDERDKISRKMTEMNNLYNNSLDAYTNQSEQKEDYEAQLKTKQIENTSYYLKAKKEYDSYLASGMQSTGGLVMDSTIERYKRELSSFDNQLSDAHTIYNINHKDSFIPKTDAKDETPFQQRRRKIFVEDREEILAALQEQRRLYESLFKKEFVLKIMKSCEAAISDIKLIDHELKNSNFDTTYSIKADFIKDDSDYHKILEYAAYLKEREKIGSSSGQMTLDAVTDISDDRGEELEKAIEEIIGRVIDSKNDTLIKDYTDYRNYMTYKVTENSVDLATRILSGSGAEVQIPTILICLSALLMIYNNKSNSSRLVFVDEPFSKMDDINVIKMVNFMRNIGLQVIFCAPNKVGTIGTKCDVIVPLFRIKEEHQMQAGSVEFHKTA